MGGINRKWVWQTGSGNWIKGLVSITREIRVFSRAVTHLLKQSGQARSDGQISQNMLIGLRD